MPLFLLNPHRFGAVIVPGDTGYVLGGTASEYQQSGWDTEWTSDDNILAEANDADMASSKSGEESTILQASNFGFSVPVGATITKVHAQVRGGAGGLFTGNTGYVQLFNGLSTPIGSEQTLFSNWSTSAYTTSSHEPNDAWGASLTPAIVNSSGFAIGFRFEVSSSYGNSAKVSWIKAKVFWE